MPRSIDFGRPRGRATASSLRTVRQRRKESYNLNSLSMFFSTIIKVMATLCRYKPVRKVRMSFQVNEQVQNKPSPDVAFRDFSHS